MSNKALEKIPEVIKILEYLLELSKIRDNMENPSKAGEDIWCSQLRTCLNILKDE
jgi:hypothetical protein|tara:strand:- start:1133 stop:1297 length:165 start_codon:yes stop_codon:yes gene_type:complete